MSLAILSAMALQQYLLLVQLVSSESAHHKERLASNSKDSMDSMVYSSGSSTDDSDKALVEPVFVSSYSSWKLPREIRILCLRDGTEALQFVGRTGRRMRSLQAPYPLPKPRQYTLFTQKSPPPLARSRTGWRPRSKPDQHVPQLSPTTLTCFPFSEPFVLADGSVCEEDRLVSYFEAKILEDPKDVSDICSLSDLQIFEDLSGATSGSFDSPKHQARHSECVVLGIATADFDVVRNFPGRKANSFGFHGNDGSLYANGKRLTAFGEPFGAGDMVGCGVDYVHGKIFFAKNGRFVGYAKTAMDPADFAKLRWFPTIGLDAPVRLQVNLDGPFLFDFLSLDTESSERTRACSVTTEM